MRGSGRSGRFELALTSIWGVAMVIGAGCGPVPRLGSLRQIVVISERGDTRLESHGQPRVAPRGSLPVSVAIRNTSASPIEVEKVMATLVTADGGLLAEQAISSGFRVSPQTSERRHADFAEPWPDDAVLVVWTYLRGVDGTVSRVGSCTPICFSCDTERTQRACEIETGEWAAAAGFATVFQR